MAQKTSVSVYFDSIEKTIHRVSRQSEKLLYSIFDDRMDKTLQKIGSNAMTRTIRQYLKIVSIGIGGASYNDRIPVYGVYVGNKHLLAGIIIDVVRCSPETAKELTQLADQLTKITSQIVKLRQKIDDRSIEMMNKLQSQKDDMTKQFANLIDYERVAESIYYNLLRYIVAEIDQGHSGKLFELAIELFKSILQKSFSNVMTGLDDKDIRILYNACIDYVFTISFTNFNHMEVLRNISKRYPKDIIEILNKLDIKKYDSLEKLPQLLDAIKVLRISPIAFNTIIAKVLNEKSLSIIYSTYDYFVAWAVLTNHYSLLFDIGPIDKEIQSQMETIVLNYKSQIRVSA